MNAFFEEELFSLYQDSFSFVVREGKTVRQILANEENKVIEKRDEKGQLVGASVINHNTILLLCVGEAYRNRGIGSWLLAASEKAIQKAGYLEAVVGAGFDYITPGVPTSKRYFPAENEELSPGIDETASNFFTKRGYCHSWGCNCFDMRFPLSRFTGGECRIGNTIGEFVYRWAGLEDLEAVCACTDDAWPDFTQFYRREELYQKDSDSRVLAAFSGGEAVGTLIVQLSEGGRLGSVGCTAVREAYRGKHIAVNLVTLGTGYLKEAGAGEAFLGYTYTGLDHLYGYAGYKICCYYMMAVKKLGLEKLSSANS